MFRPLNGVGACSLPSILGSFSQVPSYSLIFLSLHIANGIYYPFPSLLHTRVIIMVTVMNGAAKAVEINATKLKANVIFHRILKTPPK